ncbi:MAG: ABC transporter permease [Actinobacteria bacterium]|nr:ABC transporter permease [Actinomycetota bacterium]
MNQHVSMHTQEDLGAPAIDGSNTPQRPLAPEREQVPDAPARRGRSLRGVGYRYGLIGVWIIEIAIFAVLSPHAFFTVGTATSLLSSQAALIVLALSVVPTLAAGEYDLSAAGAMTLAATVVGQLNGVLGLPIGVAVAIGLVAAALVGAINALLVVGVGVQSIVVTLGMGTFLIGISVWISNSLTIGGVSPEFGRLLNSPIIGINASFFVALLIGVVSWYVYRHTPFGRHVVFIGQNREVARLSGLHVSRVRVVCFLSTSVMAGVSGVMVVGIAGGLQPSSLQGLLLPAFAAAFLGSAVFEPGKVNPMGTIVALLFLATGINGLVLLGLDAWIRDVFYGAAVVLAVTVSHLLYRRAQRKNLL